MQHRRLAAALIAGAVAVPAVASAGDTPKAQPAQSQTIVGVASGDPQFSTLVSLVKSAGLAETLSQGSYTVFAPTNRAFAKVPKSTIDALKKDRNQLRAVLLYHVVDGRVPASRVVKLKSAKTLNGASVRISVRGKRVFLNRNAQVTKTDVGASNGIVHVLNRVLIPPKG